MHAQIKDIVNRIDADFFGISVVRASDSIIEAERPALMLLYSLFALPIDVVPPFQSRELPQCMAGRPEARITI